MMMTITRMTSRRGAVAASLLAVAVLAGCASNIKATRLENPPPTEIYSGFGRIEVKPLTLARGVAANPDAVAKMQANIDKELGETLATWNARPDNGRTLVVTPVVQELRFLSVGVRIFTGPLSGDSAVRLSARMVDGRTGQTIDEPEFFQRSSAGSGFALGVADNLMLMRVAQLFSRHMTANYSKAVGSATGANDQLVAPPAAAPVSAR